jgi:hypothetical protein
MKQVWQAEDGKIFESEQATQAYEDSFKNKQELKVDEVMNCYGVKGVVKDYGLLRYGTWEVRGEDPNCDFGGYHHNPFIGYYEGTLESVIKETAKLQNFFYWGYGGSIKLIEAKKV